MRNAEGVESLVAAIMTGKLVRRFGDGLVEISLTYEEREAYLSAICDRYVTAASSSGVWMPS